jgi:acyl CoA:acetate/3-ketoacid CoA transferase beta subunit
MPVTIDELMTVVLARLIPDRAVVQVGAGVPLCLVAAALAKATHAPAATFLPFGISGLESRRPFMVTLRALEAGAYASCFPHDPMGILTRTEGEGAMEPVAPAQIDRRGNINTVALGPNSRPQVRLPGIAGVDLLGTMKTPMILYTTRHSPRVLVDKVDLVMAPGRWGRRQLGVTDNGGPRLLVTNLAVFGDDPAVGWRATSVHPGVSWEEVRSATGFPLPEHGPGRTTELPTDEELRLVREKIDPFGLRKLEFLPARERRDELRRIIREERVWLAQRGIGIC